jgi:glutamine amidotransferase
MEPVRDAHARKVPFLGICLGMQALFQGSEEGGQLEGFGIFPGRAVALPRSERLPHMGWNQLHPLTAGRLLRNISSKAWFYFAHSYAVAAGAPGGTGRVIEMRTGAPLSTEPPEGTVALCTHGRPFVAVVERDNVFGVQFHPEKSGAAGMDVLRNFLGAIR